MARRDWRVGSENATPPDLAYILWRWRSFRPRCELAFEQTERQERRVSFVQMIDVYFTVLQRSQRFESSQAEDGFLT